MDPPGTQDYANEGTRSDWSGTNNRHLEGDEEDSTVLSTTITTLALASEHGDPADDDGGTPLILLVVTGLAALTTGVPVPCAIRRRRSGS